MMEFETWNRDKLIEEVKNALTAGGLFIRPEILSFYSDEKLHENTDSQLQDLYIQLKKHDPVFCQEYEESNRFFNQPVCNADFNYWAKQAYWTIDEAIALILGKDPRKVTRENLKPYLSTSSLAKKFQEIRESAKRYVSWNQLYDPVLPGIFLAWTKRMHIDIPPALQEAVSVMGIQVADWKGNYEKTKEQYDQLKKSHEKALELIEIKEQTIKTLSLRITSLEEKQEQTKVEDLKETERQSLYKLIAAMAYDGYGYNSTDKKSPIPKEISDAVISYLGENIDPDTARKWLKKATEAYPNQILNKTE